MNFRRMANNIAVANASTLTTRTSLDTAEAAFEAADGTTRDKLAAALRAAALNGFTPEPLLDLPEGWMRFDKPTMMRHFRDEACLLWRHSLPQMREIVADEAAQRADSHELVRELREAPVPTR